jgi:hypothetical protein
MAAMYCCCKPMLNPAQDLGFYAAATAAALMLSSPPSLQPCRLPLLALLLVTGAVPAVALACKGPLHARLARGVGLSFFHSFFLVTGAASQH